MKAVNIKAEKLIKLHSIPRFCVITSLITSLVVLFGWSTDNLIFTKIHPSFVSMNPLTAICFLLTGVSLIFMEKQNFKLTILFSALSLALSIAKFIDLFGISIPVDQLFFSSSIGGNKMAPNTAFCFLLLNIAFIFREIKSRDKFHSIIPSVLVLITFFVSAISVIGYIYDINFLYTIGKFISMAFNTALLFSLLAIGFIFTLPDKGPFSIFVKNNLGGTIIRRMLPAIIFMPPLLGWINDLFVKKGIYNADLGTSLLVILEIFILGALTIFCAKKLSIAEEHLRELNINLENKVDEKFKQLEIKEAQLLHLQKMDSIGSLAGGVAHDFNNILGAIHMYCDVVKTHLAKNNIEKAVGYIDEIFKTSQRGANLTRQLLLFSRQQIQSPEVIQLNQLINNTLKMLYRLVRENIKIETKLEDQLPLIEVDPHQIEQVLMNLVINARDAMPRGGTIIIKTTLKKFSEKIIDTHLEIKKGDYIELSVADTGEGMTQETKAKIFDPFFTTKPLGQGTGLGLSTVYGIVKAANASIWVYSEPSKGSIFKIYIPIADGQEFNHAEVEEESSKVNLNNLTILIVEDDDNLRNLYLAVLEEREHKVYVAENGEEGFELMKANSSKIDLLITDVIMPGMGGVELAEKALEIKADLKILYMSGYTDQAINISPEQSGQVDFIQKPFNASELIKKIASLF